LLPVVPVFEDGAERKQHGTDRTPPRHGDRDGTEALTVDPDPFEVEDRDDCQEPEVADLKEEDAEPSRETPWPGVRVRLCLSHRL
jgi:hypothetical protein